MKNDMIQQRVARAEYGGFSFRQLFLLGALCSVLQACAMGTEIGNGVEPDDEKERSGSDTRKTDTSSEQSADQQAPQAGAVLERLQSLDSSWVIPLESVSGQGPSGFEDKALSEVSSDMFFAECLDFGEIEKYALQPVGVEFFYEIEKVEGKTTFSFVDVNGESVRVTDYVRNDGDEAVVYTSTTAGESYGVQWSCATEIDGPRENESSSELSYSVEITGYDLSYELLWTVDSDTEALKTLQVKSLQTEKILNFQRIDSEAEAP